MDGILPHLIFHKYIHYIVGLKKVEHSSIKPKSSIVASGGLGVVASILSRRMAIQGEEENDSSDDDGWSDEDDEDF